MSATQRRSGPSEWKRRCTKSTARQAFGSAAVVTTKRRRLAPRSSKLTFPNFANGRLKGVVPAARRLVVRLKLYPQGDAALWNIHSLNGIDKHNRIIVAEAATMEILATATMPFFFSTRTGGFQIGGGASADAV